MNYEIDIKVRNECVAEEYKATLITAGITLPGGRRVIQQLAIPEYDGLVPGLLAEAIGQTVVRLIRNLPV